MIIGNFKSIYDTGARPTLGKWYFGVMVERFHPAKFVRGGVKPWFMFLFVKWIRHGEPGMIDGPSEVKKGFVKRWECPIGVVFEILRNTP